MKSPEEIRYLSQTSVARRLLRRAQGWLLNTQMPIFEAKEGKRTNIGKYFERYIGMYAEKTLPPSPTEKRGVLAFLNTNERLPQQTFLKMLSSDKVPNGYLVGAGVGSILQLTDVFSQGFPEAILMTDVMPEVVLAGRIMINKLKKYCNFSDFWIHLHERRPQDFEQVFHEEKNYLVRNRLVKARRQAHELLLTMSISASRRSGSNRVPKVIESIRENYDLFHTLAKNGNMAITLADITNPFWISAIASLPQFGHLRNVIHLSNTIDHITNRGTEPLKVNRLSHLRALGEGEDRGNWYVDTTAHSSRYRLRANYFVPTYDLQRDFSHIPISRPR
jgi:hypothetical protein